MNLWGMSRNWIVLSCVSMVFMATGVAPGKGVPLEPDGYPICLGSPGHDCGLHQDSRGTTHPALVEQDGWANRTSSRTWTIGDLVPQPISGTYTLPVVIFGYSNVSQPDGVLEHLQTLLGAESPVNSMRSYYQTMSGGRFDVIPEFFVIPNLPEEDTFYETTEANPLGEYRLLQHVVAALDHQVDFTRYDNDGPDGIPNSGDDDGRVDTMILVFPECANREEGNIWPHANHAIWLNEGAGVPTADPSENPNPDNGGDVVVLGKYTLQTTVNCEGQIVNRLRTFKHELGHCLGIRDLYDTEVHNDEDDDPWAGLGAYCLMASGSGHMSAWCKARLGWVDVVRLNGLEEALVEFPRSFANEQIWKIDLNYAGTEYFLIEHRSQDDQFDTVIGFGLLIYHVDESRRTNNRPDCSGLDPNSHPKVTLEQSDGNCDLENGASGSWHSHYWRGDMVDRFASDSFPHALAYNGFDLGIEIREISDPWQETMTAVVTAPEPPLVPLPGPVEIVWLFDLSGSYADDLVHMRAQIQGAIQDIEDIYPDSRHALASFIDYPMAPWGEPGDYPYQVHTDFIQNPNMIQNLIDDMVVGNGADSMESQYEALYQILTSEGADWHEDGVYDPAVGDIQPFQYNWSDDHKAVIVMMTDAPCHDGFSELDYPWPMPIQGRGLLHVQTALHDPEFFPTIAGEAPHIFVLDATHPYTIETEFDDDGLGGYPGSGSLLEEQATELAFSSGGAYLRAGVNTSRFRDAVREILGQLMMTSPMIGSCIYEGTSGDPICESNRTRVQCLDLDGEFLPFSTSCEEDCDSNGTADLWEILVGEQTGADVDINDNGVLDSCECLGDLDFDNDVDIDDLLKIVSYWGECSGGDPCDSDFDSNWHTDIEDLLFVLSRWGDCQGCAADEITDCNDHCAPENWLGDGTCDDGAYEHNGYLIDFNCVEFGFDGGDCVDCFESEIPDCNGNCAPATWLGDGFCDEGQSQSEYNGIFINFNCESLDYDGGDCLP